MIALLLVSLAASLLPSEARVVSRKDPVGGACILDLNTDLPKKNEPLFLQRTPSGSLDLVLPEMEGKRGVIALREGENILISCPGKKNHIAATNTEYSGASCKAGKTLSIGGSDYSSTDLDCSSRASSTTRPTQKKCAGGKGIIVELGFDVDNSWIPMIESCHDVEKSNTFYSVHTVHGAIMGGKVYRTTARPLFSRGDNIFFKGFNPETAYAQKNQKEVLTRELGAANANKYFLSKKTFFLARGHLAPDADFLFSAHQFLTYFYVNVAPQWQSINAGHWLKVEDNTRKIAKSLGADLQVVTGTQGVLTLPSTRGEKEIRLQDSRLPVPEHFWKVLRNTQDDSCIAFVSTNNPFLTSAPKTICKDICAENRWPKLQDDLSKGYVYCCRYEDLKRAVPEMPNLTCKSLLKGEL
uniref:Double-stranded RNA degrading enzyme n=1 Tax=Plautia stali TaxID=106108 RepID=A0A7G1PV77_PLAST|nr:double-stranded RNA degrading enzyme [Plautia stali]